MTDPPLPPPWAAPVASAPASDAPLPASWGQTKPPRPSCLVGALLMILASVPVAVGSFVTWFEVAGDITVNGFTNLANEDRGGPFYVVVALILLGFGITTLAAKRILPVAILAVVFASFTVVTSFGEITEIFELQDFPDGDLVTMGPGLPIALVGALVGLAGGIVALATRRR